MLLSDLPPSSCVFLIATADCLHGQLPEPLLALFPLAAREVRPAASSSSAAAAVASSATSTLAFELHRPSADQLIAFFKPIVDELKREIPRMRQITQMEQLPVLPRAIDAPAAAAASVSSLTPEQQVSAESSLSPSQLSHKLSHESNLLLLQRMSLRGLLQKLMHSFPEFVHRLNRDDYPDYVDVVAEAIALDDLMHSLNEDESFDSVSKFLLGLDLLVNNTKEYSAHHVQKYRSWVNKACHLQDTALSMVAQLDTNLVQQCEVISKRRAIRKAKAQAAAGASAAAAAVPARTNLRSQTKVSEDSTAASAAASLTAAAMADSADAPTKMEVDGETDGGDAAGEEETKVKEESQVSSAAASLPAAATTSSIATTGPLGASPPPSAASLSSTVAVAPALSSAATPSPVAAISATAPSSSPIPILLPMPPALELDGHRLALLASNLAATLQGCSVERAEQVAFQIMKVVVSFQMKPERNQAMDEIDRIAQENKL